MNSISARDAKALRNLWDVVRTRAYDETAFDVPFPMGHVRAGIYWFTPTHALTALRVPGTPLSRCSKGSIYGYVL